MILKIKNGLKNFAKKLTFIKKYRIFVEINLIMYDNKNKSQNRLIFLAKKFEVFTDEEFETIIENNKNNEEVKLFPIKNHNDEILAIKWVYLPNKERKRSSIKVTISIRLFKSMIFSDPTENKMFLHWMLNTFVRMIKDDEIKSAIQFADEDLDNAKIYLQLFEANKRKKKFNDWALKNEYRKWKAYHENGTINEWKALKYDPADINHYKSLSQLFDAIDPFIERIPSNLERAMNHFVSIGEAEIPYRDRKWTVFIPLTRDANVVFDKFAGWCTSKPNNGMFERYTAGYKRPDGKNSTIYIIVNNKVFDGESNECYQIHFESKQIKDQSNGENVNLYESVFSTNEGIREYFHYELGNLSRMFKGDINDNFYLDYLISFGYTEALFDCLDENIPILKINGREVPKLPDISKFKKVDQLLLIKVGLHELHPSIGELSNLELLSLSYNKLTKIPKEIGKLKKLDFINLKGNPIKYIPEEIAELDPSKGGRLFRISIDFNDIGEANYKRLKELLPNVIIGT